MMRRQTAYGLLLILFLVFVASQLSLIPINSSRVELDSINSGLSIPKISENPTSLPYKAIVFTVGSFFNSVRFFRIISIIFFGICVVALYRVLKRWHSDKIALYASSLFATNAVALSVARLASPLVLLFGWSIIISLLLWVQHGHSKKLAPFSLAIFSAALFYIPGAPYFFLLLILLFFNKLSRLLKFTKTSMIILGVFVGLLIISPLVLGFIQDVDTLKNWLLIPNSIDWGNVPRAILRVPSALIYRMPVEPLINVGRLPIFDVASGGLFLIGLYAYKQHIKLERIKIMTATAIFSIILGALGQLVIAIVILLPFIYVVIAAGLSYLLGEWYKVFPRNPFARSFGLILVTLIVIFSMYYQLTRFLVVWPQAPETRATYDQSRIIN